MPYDLIKPLTDEELEAGYRDLLGIGGTKTEEADDTTSEELTGNDAWRHPEYRHLRETPDDAFLSASDPGVPTISIQVIGRVRSVEVLRETRALAWVHPRTRRQAQAQRGQDAAARASHCRRNMTGFPPTSLRVKASTWNSTAPNSARGSPRPRFGASRHLATTTPAAASFTGLEPREIGPRFVTVHTLAHLLINELIFTCGYSSASLRERLYVSEAPSGRWPAC